MLSWHALTCVHQPNQQQEMDSQLEFEWGVDSSRYTNSIHCSKYIKRLKWEYEFFSRCEKCVLTKKGDATNPDFRGRKSETCMRYG